MNLKEITKHRRTVKIYDSSKKISDGDLNQILDFVYQSPTSMNWQTAKVVVVKSDSKIFSKFGENTNGFNWSKVKDAPITLYFLAPTEELKTQYAIKRGRIALKGTKEVISDEEAIASQSFGLGFISEKIDGGFQAWAARQNYITMSFAVIAASTLGIDSTIQEGINADVIKDIFVEENIMDPGEHVVLAVSMGYRSEKEGAVLPTSRNDFSETIKIAK